MKVFNKSQKDFSTLEEYNNYLEEKEDIIFSIVNEGRLGVDWNWRREYLSSYCIHFISIHTNLIDLYHILLLEPNAEEAKAKIRAYEEENKALIVLRQSERADEERSIQDRIAAEQRDMERKKRELQEEERAIALTKRKFKQESTEVLLGEREEISADLIQAAMHGYRNEVKRMSRGAAATNFVNPKVREPKDGWQKEKKLDRETFRKRQAAGGGIPSGGNIASHEKNWNETLASLFAGL